MLENFIAYFVRRHLLTNLLFIMILVAGFMSWPNIKKEELPDVTFDIIRISASYPGATAEEVEHFVTREIEEKLEGLDGSSSAPARLGSNWTAARCARMPGAWR